MIGHRRDFETAALIGIVCGLVACMRAERIIAVQGDGDGGGDTGHVLPPFSPATMVSGLRGDAVDVHDPALTEDALEIYFSSETNGSFDIWTSVRTSPAGAWNSSAVVSELSTPGNDLDPDVSPDGLVLYFSSDRPGAVAGAGYRLYVSRRAARDQPWGAPQEMTGLGPSMMDMGPSVDPSGLVMVFASQRDQTPLGLYAASRSDPLGPWGIARSLSEINSDRQDQNPALFDHALSLIWSSRGPSNGSTSDLQEVNRSSPALPFPMTFTSVDALNSQTDWDGDPWVSQDGRHILFVSDRGSGVSRIYEAWR